MKSIGIKNYKFIQTLKKNGHIVCTFDEEGLLFHDAEKYCINHEQTPTPEEPGVGPGKERISQPSPPLVFWDLLPNTSRQGAVVGSKPACHTQKGQVHAYNPKYPLFSISIGIAVPKVGLIGHVAEPTSVKGIGHRESQSEAGLAVGTARLQSHVVGQDHTSHCRDGKEDHESDRYPG